MPAFLSILSIWIAPRAKVIFNKMNSSPEEAYRNSVINAANAREIYQLTLAEKLEREKDKLLQTKTRSVINAAKVTDELQNFSPEVKEDALSKIQEITLYPAPTDNEIILLLGNIGTVAREMLVSASNTKQKRIFLSESARHFLIKSGRYENRMPQSSATSIYATMRTLVDKGLLREITGLEYELTSLGTTVARIARVQTH